VRTRDLRDQLDEANKNVSGMKNVVRSAERDLNVSELEKDSLRKSLASNVSKIESLIGSTRTMRAHRASMKEGINDIRRKNKERQEVYVPLLLSFPSCSDLIPTFLVVL
jgi:hypothetical protein